VQVEGGVEGIIPSSELPRSKGKPGPPVNVNEEVTVKLINLRPEERKMTLSLRALQPPEEREAAPVRETPVRETAPREPAAREGGGGKRGRSEREDREEYGKFPGGGGGRQQQDEPRFNAFGEAYSAAKRNKRDRRSNEDEFGDDYSLDDAAEELEVDSELEPADEISDHDSEPIHASDDHAVDEKA
jgi:hypothetical protein